MSCEIPPEGLVLTDELQRKLASFVHWINEEPNASDVANKKIQEMNEPRSLTNLQSRFMTKAGHCNLKRSAAQMGTRYVTDIFTTLVDLRWKYNLIIFVVVYTVGWSLFGFFWWMIAFIRGDIDAHARQLTNHTYCVEQVYSYRTAFLFFMETETTIGYGRRAITDHCGEAVFLFAVQASKNWNPRITAIFILLLQDASPFVTSLIFIETLSALLGSIVDAFMVGCIFIKLSQPGNQAENLIFSDTCVITVRNGKYCLLFRVANLRNSLLIQCKIRAKFVQAQRTQEGEFIGMHQTDIDLGFDTGCDNLFLVTPLTICHEINEKSPFYTLSKAELRRYHFEIIVILEGMIESTDQRQNFGSANKEIIILLPNSLTVDFAGVRVTRRMICQSRTSYLNTEVLWGHRFGPVLSHERDYYIVDNTEFNTTFEVPMAEESLCSFQQKTGLCKIAEARALAAAIGLKI